MTFFAVQKSSKGCTTQEHSPDLFLAWIQTVSMAAWDLGKEQTIGVKGNHQDKQCINYKKEGDGFLADAICEDGYTYSFFFHNMPAPKKKFLNKKFSPLHARVLFLFEQFQEENHICGLDNLYHSIKFAREAYVGGKCVMVHGVTRKSS
jgi:hypothetical protein